ncbi:hypothetical protein DFAR_860006 [Desulfarculales bacterium]
MSQMERGLELMEGGCNRSQAMLGGFGTVYGLNDELDQHLSRAVGGSMRRQALTCGALTAAR